MATSPLDILSGLNSPKWRGIDFRTGKWTLSFDQGHADHLFPDRDAGLIEATGRNPMMHSTTAYFRNGLTGLDFSPYPSQWRLFLAACADKSTGTLIHPELGPMSVKCASCVTTWDPGIRDGVDVEVSWKESPAADEELTDLLKQASPVAFALSSARDLDNALGNISPVPSYPDALTPSLFESMKQLTGAFAQFKMGVGNIGAGVDNMLGGLSDLRDAVTSSADPKAYKALLAIDRAFDAVLNIANSAKPKSRPITIAVAKSSTTPDVVAAAFATPIDDFLRMNPAAAAKSNIAAGTQVFVYA